MTKSTRQHTLGLPSTVKLLTVAALALLTLCGAFAVTAASASAVRSIGASPCGGAHDTSICASDFAHAGGEPEEGDEELEEGEAEEAASSETRAEEASLGGAGSPSTPTSTPTTDPGLGTSVVVVSRLALTAKTAAALEQRKPSASTIGFSFTLSAPARLRVTLGKQVSGHKPKRWAVFPDSVAFEAAKGHVSHTLSGHNRLSPGRYRLTVKPAGGTSRSIYLRARR